LVNLTEYYFFDFVIQESVEYTRSIVDKWISIWKGEKIQVSMTNQSLVDSRSVWGIDNNCNQEGGGDITPDFSADSYGRL
jgi:hypothetical protein